MLQIHVSSDEPRIENAAEDVLKYRARGMSGNHLLHYLGCAMVVTDASTVATIKRDYYRQRMLKQGEEAAKVLAKHAERPMFHVPSVRVGKTEAVRKIFE